MSDALDPAAFYTGIVADAYAALKSTSFDADRYERFVREHGEPALEIGCGDGHPLLDLRAAGLDVAGLDSSADMLERCRENARRRGLTVDLYCKPMQEMSLGRTFSSIYLAGPTFNLLPDDEAGRRALRAISAHLEPDGVALVPLWVPPPTPAADLGRTREQVDEMGVTLRYTALSETYDERSRNRTTSVRYERVSPSGDTETTEREWLIHWWTPAAFTSLCSEADVQLLSLEVGDGGADLVARLGRA